MDIFTLKMYETGDWGIRLILPVQGDFISMQVCKYAGRGWGLSIVD